MFIDNKLFVLFCAFLLFQFAQCRKKRQMKEMEYSIHNYSSSEIDFLKLDYDGSSTKRSKSTVWKWKKDTPQISIEIPPNAFNGVAIKASNGSFSLELDAKIQKRSKMSAVRFRCQKPDGSEGLCLEILFYLKRSEISLHYWNADSLPELVRFKSGKLTTKKWWNFKFHIDTNASFIGISTDLGKKSGIYVAKGVNFNLQSITSIQVCGRTQRHRFLGQIRKLSMYVPGLVSFSDQSETQPLEPASQEKSSRNALTKRGALRPMEPGGNLAARSEIRETLRTPTLHALRSTNNIDATVDQKVQRCLDENQSLNVMITQLRQSLAQVEQRLTNLESCECVPVRCIDASGVFHSNDEEWMEGRCTTCVCRQGQVHCHNISGCQENPGFCASEPCQNNAQCEELEDGYRCRCLDGFHGPECQHTDSCDLNVCRNGGSCVHEASSYRCECPKPYRGTHCELTDWCRRRPCLNGVCTNTKYSRTCDCRDGYIGDSCQYGDPCYSSPCMNGAICTPFFGSRLRFMCACVTGYKGERCEQLDHCATEPCLNGGECQNRGQSFVCRCPNGFTGPRCDLVDACAEEPCMNGARCHNDDDGFHCTCVGHYTGSLCETLDACRVSPCLNGGRCTPNDDVTQGGFSCACPPTHTGPLCDTIDHCSSTPCMNGAQCSNTDSGFSCRCRGSHFGARCERSNYCRANPCRHNAICSNTPLNDQQPFTCTCPDGFTGVICELTDRCASNPCLHRGVCSNEGGGYHCACTPPYTGQRCETYDYCHRQPCLNEGRCTNKIAGFECKCLEAFTGDRCQNTHPCSANPCRNNGICTMVDEGYTCECPPTHYGPHCRLTNACHVNPCQNGGICINDNQGYRCDCLGGFHGDDCSSRNLCRADYCLNGGVCTSQDGGPKCTCPPTHKGPRCGSLCNICLYASDAGQTCARDQVPFAGAGPRWFHDRFTGACRQFNYRGCEGNINNFATRQECRQRCIVGACCMKQRGSSQTVCRTKSLSQCKRINVERGSRYQVIGFKAGEACSASICANDKTCKIGAEEYTVGSTVRLGCSETCDCIAGGILQCACSTPSQRKEIRKFLPDELTDFISAVRSLKTTELEDMSNAWDAIRDDYIQHSPIAQSGAHFLAWNRAFLRRVEMALRENNCKATIPYFDFTLDAGNFSNSVLWQPNYFGGEGNCIPDHPFRIFHNYRGVPWQPCLVRHFNTSVPVPSMVDVAIAMKATTQAQLSRQLLEIVSYVRSYIGGDMATTGAAYDPVFYPIHAYIDHLFSEWQKLNPQQADADLGKVPLGFPLDYVWSGACVEYLAAHQVTSQCNVTGSAPQVFTSNGYNLNGFNPSGFNRLGYDQRGYNVLGRDRYGRKDSRSIYLQGGYSAEGYNRAGLDRRGCNEYGFCDGYNRDGFNALGYNRQGYDRYGLNAGRYDMNGFDIYGVSKSGKVDDVNFDETGFNDCCFSRDGFAVTGLDRFGFSAAGYDENQCNYYFHGPHVFYYRKKLWEILKVQPTSFLASLQRNCGPLADLPGSYLQSNWNAQLTTSTQATQASTNEHNSTCAFTKRFCFDVDSLMTWCPCLEGKYPAVCHMNPCEDNRCELHPQARCHVNFCGQTCSAEFYLRGRRVKCDNPCLSSPCLNGGTCVASQFYSASERFTCKCMSQYSGPLCERQAVDTCSLPMIVGNCNATNRRWHFDHISGACNSFTYSGCGGNLNNFPNKNACELRCSVGACCYRKISNISSLIGFDHDGYDKYGFTMYGVDRNGKKRSPHNSLPHSNNILGLKGFGHDGYNIHGYNEAGFDRQGYDRDGYHGVTGYNRTGYDRNGVYDQLTGFDRDGYDINGFDRSGFKCNGLNREGYNRLGFYEKFEYNCQSMSIERCDSIEKPFEVVAFSPGVTCDEVNCQDRCGCEMNGKTYRLGEKFSYSCQICQCTLAGTIDCTCKKMGKRKEIRDLTEGERFKYQDAVRRVYESGEWDYFVSIHSQFMKVANGGTLALPWHRYFLSNVERMLQQESDCDLSIPYFDWTIDVGSLEQSSAWNVRYFGGNGKGESNCVRYHSFGDAETWHPCIRRNFNTSVSLPNAVDFQLLLREHDYDAFRIQLETMSALFHLWVGGHMASPFSPYDPLYFSHWAFMDLIWSDWQKRSPDGMSRFPLSHRYVQFEPFDVTPDDVISSQQQSCVVYIPPTIGSACNSTTQTPNLGRNEGGFDRHGYDVNGFDIEGFDKNGQDRRGNPDERGVYDSNGFLGSGYARDGFDPQGWDRFGFRRNNFNRDGIDIEGYDRSGYDQFGFNRSKVTPFGMFKNESLAPRVDAGYVATLFDRYGYDKYGFNKHGLDYNGYSAFGYNHHGLDRDRCNYFLHGPHYMRQFYMTLMQLRNLQPADLGRVKRICEPVSLLPRWMAQGWLGDWETVLRYQKTWSNKHQSDPNWKERTSSVTEEGLWLPITPDKQFCFDMQAYSGCPVGTTLVDCEEDVCMKSRCASNPHAECRTRNCGSCYPEYYNGATGEVITCFGCIDMQGKIYSEASSWDTRCDSCLCQGGMIACHPKPCPTPLCPHPSTRPGQCCPVCQDCEFEERTYRNGQRFKHGRCETCRCVRGSVTCRSVATNCPPTPCTNPVRRAGDCCLVCPENSCGDHREGEQWSSDCDNCQCIDNRAVCAKLSCAAAPCSNPRTPRGACCPTCVGCSYNGRSLNNGQRFTEGCMQCSCRFGNVQCVHQHCPRLSCQNQVTAVGSCCPVCQPDVGKRRHHHERLSQEPPSLSPIVNTSGSPISSDAITSGSRTSGDAITSGSPIADPANDTFQTVYQKYLASVQSFKSSKQHERRSDARRRHAYAIRESRDDVIRESPAQRLEVLPTPYSRLRPIRTEVKDQNVGERLVNLNSNLESKTTVKADRPNSEPENVDNFGTKPDLVGGDVKTIENGRDFDANIVKLEANAGSETLSTQDVTNNFVRESADGNVNNIENTRGFDKDNVKSEANAESETLLNKLVSKNESKRPKLPEFNPPLNRDPVDLVDEQTDDQVSSTELEFPTGASYDSYEYDYSNDSVTNSFEFGYYHEDQAESGEYHDYSDSPGELASYEAEFDLGADYIEETIVVPTLKSIEIEDFPDFGVGDDLLPSESMVPEGDYDVGDDYSDVIDDPHLYDYLEPGYHGDDEEVLQ